MGVLRKTLSVGTFGTVDFKSDKERIATSSRKAKVQARKTKQAVREQNRMIAEQNALLREQIELQKQAEQNL